jgi:hypothetical protein
MKPPKIELAPCLSLEDVAGLTVNATCDLYANRVKVASRVFIEQGKLVHHLRKDGKLKAGQSIYGLLQAKGASEGSIQSAVVVADLIDALILPGHLTEARFDECITFRVSRMGRQLFQGKAKSGLKLDGPALAALMQSGTTAAVGAELDCLCEHGVTIAERESAQAAAIAQADADRKVAAALTEIQKAEAAAKVISDAEEAKEKADAAAAAAAIPANVTPITAPTPTPAPTVTAPEPTKETNAEAIVAVIAELEDDDVPDDVPETDETEDEAPAPLVVDGTKSKGPPPAPPVKPAITLVSVPMEIDAALTRAMSADGLNAEDTEKLVHYLRGITASIESTLDSLKVA